MNSENLLRLWLIIDALPERKAKLALFGLAVQTLGHGGEGFEGVSEEALLEAKDILRKAGA